jgi:NADPH:quinone reductase-like Zn-dependent oxidoreductase
MPTRDYTIQVGDPYRPAKVTKGDFVLISAASGSTGLAAIQIANYAGAITIALTRTSAKKLPVVGFINAASAHGYAPELASVAAGGLICLPTCR